MAALYMTTFSHHKGFQQGFILACLKKWHAFLPTETWWLHSSERWGSEIDNSLPNDIKLFSLNPATMQRTLFEGGLCCTEHIEELVCSSQRNMYSFSPSHQLKDSMQKDLHQTWLPSAEGKDLHITWIPSAEGLHAEGSYEAWLPSAEGLHAEGSYEAGLPSAEGVLVEDLYKSWIYSLYNEQERVHPQSLSYVLV